MLERGANQKVNKDLPYRAESTPVDDEANLVLKKYMLHNLVRYNSQPTDAIRSDSSMSPNLRTLLQC